MPPRPRPAGRLDRRHADLPRPTQRRLALRGRPRHDRDYHTGLPADLLAEPNAIERLWLYLEERFLSHRLWPDDDAIVEAVGKASQRVNSDTGRISSLYSMEWAQAFRN
jgi:hypothetical protein